MKPYLALWSALVLAISAGCENSPEIPANGTGGLNSGSGGSPVTGGSSVTGGATAATGGNATGGKATGGTATGGKAAGGTATGGAAAGGSGTAGSGATANITLWLAGDSTMQNCSSTCPCGWGNQFDPYFNSRVTVTNNAAGGRSIQTWLYEANVSSNIGSDGECVLTSTTYASRWTNMLSTMKSGDYLFIAFGINDGDSTCPRHVGSARFQTLMTYMVTTAKGVGVNPILLTPTAAIACSGSTATKNRGFITETKAVATATGVPLIDLNQLSVDLYNSLGLCPNAADYTSTTSAVGLFFCADHTHFEAAGAQQIAGQVANALRTQSIPLAAYLN